MTDAKQFENRGDGLVVRAPAKVNLSLLIAGKRPDGFHEIETVMAKLAWYDEILIEPGAGRGDRTALHRTGMGAGWPGEPGVSSGRVDSGIAAADRSPNVRLTLTKNIPARFGTGRGQQRRGLDTNGTQHLS